MGSLEHWKATRAVRDESVDWVAQITRLITPFEGDAPRFAALEPPAQSHVRAELQRLVATLPQLRGRDTLRFPYRTLAFDCTRIGGERVEAGTP